MQNQEPCNPLRELVWRQSNPTHFSLSTKHDVTEFRWNTNNIEFIHSSVRTQWRPVGKTSSSPQRTSKRMGAMQVTARVPFRLLTVQLLWVIIPLAGQKRCQLQLKFSRHREWDIPTHIANTHPAHLQRSEALTRPPCGYENSLLTVSLGCVSESRQ